MDKKEIIRNLFDVRLKISLTHDNNELVILFKEKDDLISLLKRTIMLERGYNLVHFNKDNNKRRGR